ncbi:ABC-2 type transport system permease protein [Prauserella shujinwangii]|uniref:ABC-2 type transport system permease protein n=1 Tax=Prauserella shujinwangii TaxID=1453103 RepID=A0A2T0LUY9_9PSEU|nr:ABC transporter permease [Prauserella shujinwangii]PRX47644.1 ABC-2 type transport system permease protein [Prauserella shujinwangii]
MTLLAVERIKLFSTRSPWWCAVAALVLTTGFTALVVGNADEEFPATVASTQFGYSFGLAVIMVLAALAVTTEYRFGTIRTTFQAIPNRTAALLAKTTVVALLSLVIGEIVAFASWGLSLLLQPQADLALNSTADWINVAGVGPVYAFAAVMAVAVGILVRHSAGAISLLLIYNLAVESLVSLIPNIGDDIYEWMPFNVANKFLTGAGASNAGRAAEAGAPMSTSPLSPGWALAYFAGVALVLLGIAIASARRRDA